MILALHGVPPCRAEPWSLLITLHPTNWSPTQWCLGLINGKSRCFVARGGAIDDGGRLGDAQYDRMHLYTTLAGGAAGYPMRRRVGRRVPACQSQRGEGTKSVVRPGEICSSFSHSGSKVAVASTQAVSSAPHLVTASRYRPISLSAPPQEVP